MALDSMLEFKKVMIDNLRPSLGTKVFQSLIANRYNQPIQAPPMLLWNATHRYAHHRSYFGSNIVVGCDYRVDSRLHVHNLVKAMVEVPSAKVLHMDDKSPSGTIGAT
jgi:hypothetical protein